MGKGKLQLMLCWLLCYYIFCNWCSVEHYLVTHFALNFKFSFFLRLCLVSIIPWHLLLCRRVEDAFSVSMMDFAHWSLPQFGNLIDIADGPFIKCPIFWVYLLCDLLKRVNVIPSRPYEWDGMLCMAVWNVASNYLPAKGILAVTCTMDHRVKVTFSTSTCGFKNFFISSCEYHGYLIHETFLGLQEVSYAILAEWYLLNT